MRHNRVGLLAVVVVVTALLGPVGCSQDANVSTGGGLAGDEVIAPHATGLGDALRSHAYQPMPKECPTAGALPRERAVTEGVAAPQGAPDGALVRDVAGAGEERLFLLDLGGKGEVVDSGGRSVLALDGEGLWLSRGDGRVDVSVRVDGQYVVERFRTDTGAASSPVTVAMPEGAVGPALFLTNAGGYLYAAVVEEVVGDGQQQSNLYRLDGAGRWTRVTDFRAEDMRWVSVSNVERIDVDGRAAILLTEQRGDAQGDTADLNARPVIVDASTGKVIATGEAVPGDPQFIERRRDGGLVVEVPAQDGAVRISTVEPDRVLGCGRSGSRALALAGDPAAAAGD